MRRLFRPMFSTLSKKHSSGLIKLHSRRFLNCVVEPERQMSVLYIQSQRLKKLIRKAFGRGFTQFDGWGYFKEKLNKWRRGKAPFIEVCKGVARLFISTKFARFHAREKGYAYFQDFVPGNKFDIRVIVIGNKAFAVKRMCRPHDFRASGSGDPHYDKQEIDLRCVNMSFKISRDLSDNCVGFDWVFDSENNPMIVEIGYGFAINFYDPCPGYWTDDMQWHEGKFVPQNWMVEEMLK